MRLFLRLQLFVFVLMTAVLAAFGLSQASRERDLFLSDTTADNRTAARWLADAAAQVWALRGEQAARAFVEGASPGKTGARARLAPLRGGPDAELRAIAPSASDDLVVRAPVLIEGRGIAEVEIIESMAARDRYVARSLWRQGGLAAALLASAMILSTVLGFVVVGRRVRLIVDRAERAGAGDLDSRLGATSRDELGQISRALDVMCQQMSSSRARERDAAAARIQSMQQLRQADRLALVGAMASGIAHELGTPLNVVRIRADEIRTGEASGADAAAAAAIIAEQAGRMERIIRDLLDFSRPRHADRAPTELRSLATRTVRLLAPVARRHGVEVREPPAGPPRWCWVDSAQIEQVLSNLLVNAIHAQAGAPPNGAPAANAPILVGVDVDTQRGAHAGRTAQISVRDRGPGMPADLLARVFEPFVTTKPPGEGTGLGLTVSESLARENDGWISAESELGAGSVFTVHLPVCDPPAGEAP